VQRRTTLSRFFFDAERSVTVRGTVIDFQFRNPHGIIRIDVDKEGAEKIRKAETNSLRFSNRRGRAAMRLCRLAAPCSLLAAYEDGLFSRTFTNSGGTPGDHVHACDGDLSFAENYAAP